MPLALVIAPTGDQTTARRGLIFTAAQAESDPPLCLFPGTARVPSLIDGRKRQQSLGFIMTETEGISAAVTSLA